MITLYGMPLSPFYCKLKIALLEKGVNFEEVLARPSQKPEVLAHSPMGKIPWVEINGMPLCESTAIAEWLEDAYPTAALLPPTPNGRAWARQLALMWDLYAAPACRPFLLHKVFAAPLDEAARADGQAAVEKALQAIARLAKFAPWLTGDTFTLADVSAAAVLPMVDLVSDVLNEDLLVHLPGADVYRRHLLQRRSVARTWEERNASLALIQEKMAKSASLPS